MKPLEKIFLLNWYKNENIDLMINRDHSKNKEDTYRENLSTAKVNNIHDDIELSKIIHINDLLKISEKIQISDLQSYSSQSCFFEGNSKPEILIVNDYPNEEEEKNKKILTNDCEILMTNMLNAISIDYERTAKINIFFWRTPGNRKPSIKELKDCQPFVKKIIELLSPRFIITLGELSTSSILEENINILDVRGKSFDYKFQDIKIFPLFHPRVLIKQPALKRLAWEDLKIIKEEIQN